MQRGSSIFQHLTVRPNVSFDDPATPDGKLWNSALKSITHSQGWSELHWGSHLGSEENVDLIITWNSHDDLRYFMACAYQPFLTAVESILARRDGSPYSIPPPYIMQLRPGMPTLELGAISSIYELSFESQPDADLRTGLTTETQLCRNFFSETAQEVSDSDLFLGMDAVWVEQYEPAAPPSSSAAATGLKVEEGKMDDQKPKTLYVITEWTTQDAEETILGSGNIKPRDERALMNREYFTKKLLQQASAYQNHHVVFENISASNAQWLDKEEKWSTYVKKLIYQEEHKNSEEGL